MKKKKKKKKRKKWERAIHTYYTVLCFNTRQYLSRDLDNGTVTERLVEVVDDTRRTKHLPSCGGSG